MISVKSAKKIAASEFDDLKIYKCIDIGNAFAFSFASNDDIIIPGIPIVCVDKNSGVVEYMTIPPIENIDLLEKGQNVPLI